jgi:hypothetical protein
MIKIYLIRALGHHHACVPWLVFNVPPTFSSRTGAFALSKDKCQSIIKTLIMQDWVATLEKQHVP